MKPPKWAEWNGSVIASFAGVLMMMMLVFSPCFAAPVMEGSVVGSCCLWRLAVIRGRAVLRAGSG
jgi:hypothetical protein